MNFKYGRLYIRLLDGAVECLFYPEIDVPSQYRNFPTQVIAEVDFTTAKPWFGHPMECSRHGERTGSGKLVEFRLASDDDISALLSNWTTHPQDNIASWLRSVDTVKGLATEERARLIRIATTFIK